MKRAGDVKWGQVQIGAIVAVAIGFLLWASMKGGDANYWFAEKHRIHATFTDVKGLVEGAPVQLNGLEVGTVEKVSWDRFAELHKLEVTATVNRDAWKFMRQDSRASVVGIGFFGDKFLSLSAGSPGMPQLQDNGEIVSSETPDFFETLNSQSGAVKDLASLVGHLDSLAAIAASGRGTLGKALNSSELYDELTAMSGEMRRLTVALQRNQERATTSLVRMTGTVDTLARNLQGGTFGAAMRDSSLFVNLRNASARMDSVLAVISSGRGNLGKLTHEQGVYTEMDSTMHELHRIMKDFQLHPKKYLKVSVF